MKKISGLKTKQNSFLMIKQHLKGLFCFLLTTLFALQVNAQTKTVEFDWNTKDFVANKSKFPFDEPFTFKIINLPVDQKTVFKISIRDITKKKRPQPLEDFILNVTDSVVDNSRGFTQVIEKYLKPNHYFKIDIEAIERKKLTNTEQQSLYDKISTDTSFSNLIRSLFYNTDYSEIKLSGLQSLLEIYFTKSGYTNYKIDYEQVEKQADLQSYLATAKNELLKIAHGLNSAKEQLDNTFIVKAQQIDLLFESLYEKRNDGNFYLKFDPGETFEDFTKRAGLNTLDQAIKQVIKDDPSFLTDSATINFIIENKVKTFLPKVKKFEKDLEKWLKETLTKVVALNTFRVKALGSNVYDNDTEAGNYTSQTFGYGYSPSTDNSLLYFSFSFFARPVNNSVPLSNVTGNDWWKVRFCANVGLTLENIAINRNGTISGLGSVFSDKAGLVGIGFRPWSFLKIDVNSIMYYLKNPNPLINNKKFVCSPFFGVSVNLNIVSLLAGHPNSLTTLQNQINNPHTP